VERVIVTPLRQIDNPKGDIFHAIKKSDNGFSGFGEAYFTTIHKGDIKGWKRHTKMTLNLVVISGEIELVIYNGDEFLSLKLSPKKNYQRVTIKPHLWVAFRGLGDDNMLLNIANIEHDPNEADSLELSEISYEW
jgi:dTDP-4-dehydrorhamnose 3,5-epimerase